MSWHPDAVPLRPPTRVHLPVGAVTSVGRDICDLAEVAGLVLDDWQQWFVEWAMSESVPQRQWAAFEVACIVPRQNGKGSILEARQLGGLFYLREPLQVHTAHEFKTAYEHYLRITSLIEGCPDLDRKVQRIRRGAGEQAIELKTGERLRFLARSTRSGRGLTGDVVYLDEAFALSAPTMGALLPTLSAVPNPQVWYTSSAPNADSDVLHGVRNRPDDSSPRLFLAEWACERGADPEDSDNWRRANPAMDIRISEDFVRSEFDAMRSAPEEFARERLGIPDELAADSLVVPNWSELADDKSRIASHRCIALDVSPDRKWASFGAAGRRADGRVHVEAFDRRGDGTGWVQARAVDLFDEWDLPIRIEKGSPASSFVGTFREAGVDVIEVSPGEHAAAAGLFLDACENDGLRHLGGTVLDGAVKAADLRPSGDADRWSRRNPRADITPLVAVTLALGGVPTDGAYQVLDSVR